MAFSLFSWPDGLAWRIIMPRMKASRRRRFNICMRALRPKATDRVLDVGVGEGLESAVNFFEDWYPFPDMITALAIEDVPGFRRRHPNIVLIQGDGRALPFGDNEFDIYFSNAVIEHVGTFSEQRRFIHEACRVARRVFISTPYRGFPIDFHTLIPFAHYFPQNAKAVIYRFFGKDFYAQEANLRLLSKGDIIKMLPPGVRLTWYPQRILGLISNLNFVLEKI